METMVACDHMEGPRGHGDANTTAEPTEVVFHQVFGAWDFPMSRSEKIRRLLSVFEGESEAAEREAATLRTENAALKQRLAANGPQTPSKVGLPARREVSVCVSIPRDVEKQVKAKNRVSYICLPPASPHASAPGTPTTPPFKTLSPHQSISPPKSPTEPPERSRRVSECPPPAVPRRRRRTTIFQLPPEPDEPVNTEGCRWQRRSAPPTAAALAEAQAAGAAHMADVALRGELEWRREGKATCRTSPGVPAVSSFTPPSTRGPSPAPSSCHGSSPQPTSHARNRGSPPPPPRSPPLYGGHRPQPHCEVASPRLAGMCPAVHCIGLVSSIAAVEWCYDEGVHWVRFQTREEHGFALAQEDKSGRRVTGRFLLNQGEYIHRLGGRVEAGTAHAAAWLLMVTSGTRLCTIGSEDDANTQEPSFVFNADPAQEICDVVLSPQGHIHNFLQRPLKQPE